MTAALDDVSRLVSRLLLEVIVQTPADARAAAQGGADRLEVVRQIAVGGLTPPLALIRAIADETSLPLRVMLRRNTGYATTPEESLRLRADAEDIVEAGVDGLVVGFATTAGTPAVDDLRRILSAVPGARATFHRAFDAMVDPLGAIDAIRGVPEIDRILTSGGGGSPAVRCARLRAFSDRAGARVRIIAGGGVTAAMLPVIVDARCVMEVHVGRAARDGVDPDAPVSADSVRDLRDRLDATPG